jgi:hypothetical protein
MQLSALNRQAFEKKFTELAKSVTDLLRGGSVLLSGGQFNGSGVIFWFEDSPTVKETYILTAKHNLRRGAPYDPKKTGAPSTLVKDFVDNIAVYYGAVDFKTRPAKSAPLAKGADNGGNTRIFGNSTQDTWEYDVMMVKSGDPQLLAYAKSTAAVKSAEELNALGLKLFETWTTLGRDQNREFIQCGFGYANEKREINDKYLGKFQVRYTQPSAAEIADVYDYDPETGFDQKSTSVALVVADNENSTAPGDSGGPLFLVDSTKKGAPVVVLLGTTLGANQSLTENTEMPDDTIEVNSSNYIQKFICMAYPGTDGCYD